MQLKSNKILAKLAIFQIAFIVLNKAISAFIALMHISIIIKI